MVLLSGNVNMKNTAQRLTSMLIKNKYVKMEG